MSDMALPGRTSAAFEGSIDKPSGSAAGGLISGHKSRATVIAVLIGVVFCLAYAGYSVHHDVTESGEPSHALLPWLLLATALVIALAFEFVNGFHDTANAVATVIYTHSLPPTFAVVWSGAFNFLGVLFSSGAVAYSIITLLPVELILQVGSGAGFAMVFALLIAAIIWNLGTWSLGLPASSSHTLIGSVIGVGLANQLFATASGTSGVDWSQATKIGWSLLLSPLIGFVGSAVLLLAMKAFVRKPELYREPKGNAAPPWWIRGLLIFTCSGVSFAHGSNDGQKGMGLIMLILIGTVPTAYALNRALPDSEVGVYKAVFEQAAQTMDRIALASNASSATPKPAEARTTVGDYLKSKQYTPDVVPALAALTRDLELRIDRVGSLRDVPVEQTKNVRNDMYMVSDSLAQLGKVPAFAPDDEQKKVLKTYRDKLDEATKFIPTWVKVAVAFALGLGTMVGWKRIVVTVGEKIGKTHLTYGQGAAAELVAAATIAAADMYGLPVSTTHVLSSGVAGTMAASGAGLQMATIRNLVLAWVLTLPAAILLSGGLFWVFMHVF
jgi:PiT family inorganic phosphate transporter